MSTLEYIKSRLEIPLEKESIEILKRLVKLSFKELQFLLKLHSKLYNSDIELKLNSKWAEHTAQFESLIGLAFDYKYYEIFNTTFSDISMGYDFIEEWIEITKKEGPSNIDGVGSHLEQGILYDI